MCQMPRNEFLVRYGKVILTKKKYAKLAEYFQGQAWSNMEYLKRHDYEMVRYYNYLELWQAQQNRIAREAEQLNDHGMNEAMRKKIVETQAASREANDVWLESRKRQFLKAGKALSLPEEAEFTSSRALIHVQRNGQ